MGTKIQLVQESPPEQWTEIAQTIFVADFHDVRTVVTLGFFAGRSLAQETVWDKSPDIGS